MICKVYNCRKKVTHEAMKNNGEPYAQPFGYCDVHKKTVGRTVSIKDKCIHDWNIIDKWQNGSATYWEFYCKHCLEIMTVNNSERVKSNHITDNKMER